jgi:hypothetical protein
MLLVDDEAQAERARPARQADPDEPLMDEVHRWSFAKPPANCADKPAALRAKQLLRIKLRQAQRFVLDDDAVRLVCHLAHEHKRFEGWSFLAHLPYDVCWFEFDLGTKLQEFYEMGTLPKPYVAEDCALRVGLLFFKDGDSAGARWVCHEFYRFHAADGIDMPCGMLTYVFDPEGDPMWPVRGSKFWNSPTLSLIPGFPRVPVHVTARTQDGQSVNLTTEADPEVALCGIFQLDSQSHLDGKAEFQVRVRPDGALVSDGNVENIVRGPDWFNSRAAVLIDPSWRAHFGERLTDPGVLKRVTAQVQELRGAMRYAICILAAINELPRDVRPVATRPGRRAAGMHMLPYFGHSNLSIQLPRDNRVVWATKHLDHSWRNARRRMHPVRGHWRVIEYGKSTHLCRHLPVMVEPSSDGKGAVGMCERCELMIRWIADQTRGDASIGIVEHTYKVTGKGYVAPIHLGEKPVDQQHHPTER